MLPRHVPDFAEKMAAHEQHKKFSEAWRECGLVKKDFNAVVAAVSSLLGEENSLSTSGRDKRTSSCARSTCTASTTVRLPMTVPWVRDLLDK